MECIGQGVDAIGATVNSERPPSVPGYLAWITRRLRGGCEGGDGAHILDPSVFNLTTVAAENNISNRRGRLAPFVSHCHPA